MMELLREIAVWLFLASGSFFLVVGGIGVLRMPDFFTRMHAAGITDTLGAGLILVGLMVESGLTLNSGRLVLILFFLLFTSPTASHATAHGAIFSGLTPWVTGKGKGRKAIQEKTPPPRADQRKRPGARSRKGGRR